MTNSGDSPRFSSSREPGEIALVCASLCALVSLAGLWCFRHDYILYYGDAQAHLNISRSIIDSRTPGYDQLGTVWLPALHLICLPFVGNDLLWSSGLAGTIPVAFCFVIAGAAFFLAGKEVYASTMAATVVVACFALNPNVLYLASIPMTEMVFLAGLAVLLFALFRFRRTQANTLLLVGVAASWSMSLTRYDGWFLIPFAALGFALFSKRSQWSTLFAFGAIASLAPLYWIAHNWWETGNALDFYNGPYSAIAIQGGKPYAGYHDWRLAAVYYGKAGQLCSGWPLAVLGALGAICAANQGTITPVLFLLLTPLFYIWSIHSSGGTPIHLPQLPPFSYYNSRYGIAVVAVAAFASGAIVSSLPARWRRLGLLIPFFSVAPWLLHPSQDNWICWKESQVNSISRRAWTAAAAGFLKTHYQRGEGILTASATGDVSGIFSRSRIPLRETIHIGTGPIWFANTRRPDLIHQALWAVAQPGDLVTQAITRNDPPIYNPTEEIQVKDAPALEFYRRK